MPAQVLFISREFWSIHTEPWDTAPVTPVCAARMRIFSGGGAAARDGFGPARGVLLFGPRRDAAAGVVGVA